MKHPTPKTPVTTPDTTKKEGDAVLRDQHESAFASILADLVSRIPGARGAALVDADGETVDYAGGMLPFDLRVAAAHWRLVLDDTAAKATGASLGPLTYIALRAARRSYLVHRLPDGYALVVALARGGSFLGWQRAVAACNHALSEEAGWASDKKWPGGGWFALDIVADARGRPFAVRAGDRCRPVDILGVLVKGPSHRTRGWRVRFDTGAEAMLIREPGGRWYADELFEHLEAQPDALLDVPEHAENRAAAPLRVWAKAALARRLSPENTPSKKPR